MKNIDFLPDIYRQREALRKARVWWAGVVVVLGAGIGSAAGAQAWLRHRLEVELEVLAPHYAVAQADVSELAALQSQIALAGQEASLFTYLEHPWPRTQIVAHLIRPLPPSIELNQLHLTEEELSRPAPAAGPRGRAASEPAARALPAEQDLQRLRGDMDRRQTVVEIAGKVANVAELHEYVAALHQSPLVASAQIKLIDAGEKTAGDVPANFSLRVQIQFGHGQESGRRLPTAALPPNPPAVVSSPGGAARPGLPVSGGAE